MAQRINRFGRAFATTLLVFFATGATWDYSYVGVQGLALVGVHRDVTGSEYGIGGGPLLELHVGGPRFAVHLEGIPVVSIPGVRPSVAYGQATPAIGIFNGDAEYAIAARGQLWLGFGETIYNQRTPLPAQAPAPVRRRLNHRRLLRRRCGGRRERGGAPRGRRRRRQSGLHGQARRLRGGGRDRPAGHAIDGGHGLRPRSGDATFLSGWSSLVFSPLTNEMVRNSLGSRLLGLPRSF